MIAPAVSAGGRDDVVVGEHVARRVDDDARARAALVADLHLDRDDGGHRAAGDVGHRARRALLRRDRLRDRGVGRGQPGRVLGGQPADDPADGPDEQRDGRERGECPRVHARRRRAPRAG